MNPLGQISPAQFLKRYWQKKPLLVRGAFAHFRDPITPDELAGLSCESDMESRLIMERGGQKPWQVTHGPQNVSRLKKLPDSHWTLLVQGVDRAIPAVAALLDPFRFLPDWRIDDVMISFAPRGGTVGPHIDSYDVFLLQGQGRRRWRIDSKAPSALRPGLDLRILKEFHAEADWILEPGDMLYLPPHLAHYGVALEECLTYSIGFRAPSAIELLAAAHARLLEISPKHDRYRDPNLLLSASPGEIPRLAIRELRRLMESSFRQLTEADFDALMGQMLTDPKSPVEPPARRMSAAALKARLAKGAMLVRSSGSRLVFLKRGKTTELYVDGHKQALMPALHFAAPLLSNSHRLTFKMLSAHLAKRDFVILLLELVNRGAFHLDKIPRENNR